MCATGQKIHTITSVSDPAQNMTFLLTANLIQHYYPVRTRGNADIFEDVN